jgi:tetratricopeptide (TPR) repeat protein
MAVADTAYSGADPPMTDADDSRIAAVKEHLRAGRTADAAALAESLWAEAPDSREACYLAAVALRLDQRFDAAEQRLEELRARWPRFTLALQESAHTARDRGNTALALERYYMAVTRNPTLRGCWNALAQLQLAAGNLARSAHARQQLEILTATPPALLRARHAFAEGELDEAETLCREYLKGQRLDTEGMRLLAAIAVARQVYDDAAYLLETVLELSPGPDSRLEYAKVLFKKHDYLATQGQIALLLGEDPDSAPTRLLRAHLNAATGRYAAALDDYAHVESHYAGDATFHLSYGHALKTLGRQDEAVARYRRAYTIRDDFGDAYWSLANLKTYRFTPTESRAISAALQRVGTAETDRIHLHFALGKSREDAGQYDEAFHHYASGNRLRKAQCRYDAEAFRRRLGAYREFFDRAFFERLQDAGSDSSAPIFIVGLPRSGSTLLEQILSSHPLVEGTKELPHVPGTVHTLSREHADDRRYPDCIEQLDREDLLGLGEAYLAAAALQRHTAAPHFIDKMPNNFRHVGLIHLMLPNARIIDIRRHPLACCFSNYKQLFAEGQEFSYDLEDLANYYLDYLELMAHWDQALPGRVLRVHYEELVDDLEGGVRRVLDHCGLPFDASCLHYHEQHRAVRTASSEQVRQPIYRSGLDAWKPYEKHLGVLRELLQPALAAYAGPA